MRYSEFVRKCYACETNTLTTSYLEAHAYRLHRTFEVSRKLLKPGDRVLAVGAGKAYVEAILAKDAGAKVTVVDFPEMVDVRAQHYVQSGFEMVGLNLSVEHPTHPALDQGFDLVLSAEIIEHIPQPPSQHIAMLARFAKKGGHIVVSTPNMSSIAHIAKLLFMQPLLPPPEKTFSPVSFENEGVHRREYVPSEIEAAFAQTGITYESLEYIWYRLPAKLTERVMFPVQALVPRFRPAMIQVGRR